MKIVFASGIVLMSASIFGQAHCGSPLIKKGKEIYVCSTPSEKYTEVFRVTSNDLGNLVKAMGGEEKHSLLDNLDGLVNNADRKAKKKDLAYDAIITDDGTTAICVKFDK
jgi:hypothetical protein